MFVKGSVGLWEKRTEKMGLSEGEQGGKNLILFTKRLGWWVGGCCVDEGFVFFCCSFFFLGGTYATYLILKARYRIVIYLLFAAQ